ncbi:Outer membrane protein assembly factor BamE [Candidatus Vallotia lariciata]|nr:Outer membrane protein assembly factor BamE [Candidatus Vallotia lariciata]
MDKKSSIFSSELQLHAITFSVVVRVLVFASIALLGACKTYGGFTQSIAHLITPYQITIVQGNFVSAEAASMLRVGMSKDEVRSLIGTPLLTDIFHVHRWDYMFYFKRGQTSIIEQRDLVVNFVDDRVVSWTGANNLLSERDLIDKIDDHSRDPKESGS